MAFDVGQHAVSHESDPASIMSLKSCFSVGSEVFHLWPFQFCHYSLNQGALHDMSLIESRPAFEQRCDEIFADGSLKAAFAASGVDSYSKLAFSVGTPQSPPTEAQFDAFARLVFGAGATVGQTANLKRLHFEATTLVIASLKERVTSEDAESSNIKRIPAAEKRARQENQETRLAGVTIRGELAPSHQSTRRVPSFGWHLPDAPNVMTKYNKL